MTLAPQITFRHMDTAPQLEAAVLKEAGRLERFFPRITSCRVAIEGPRRQAHGGSFNVRIDLGVPGAELVVERSPSLHTSLQEAEAAEKSKKSEPHRERRDARRAIHEAFHEMRRRLQDYARRLREQTKDREKPLVGKVIKLSLDEGFGFLESEGREVYFHRNSVVGDGFDSLRFGSPVSFDEEAGEKGPQASSVRLTRPARQRREAAASVPVRKLRIRKA
jgi:cold shock CspA family protein/ribosome-associated translation inhibitor RaiA